MTTNYFNTSSSFAMTSLTSQCSNSPHRISPGYLSEEAVDEHDQLQEYRIEDIYQGLIKIKTNKIFRIVGDMVERKCKYWKLLALRKIGYQPRNYQMKIMQYNSIYRVFSHFAHVRIIRLKNHGFSKLRQYYQQNRNKDLKILELFSNKYVKNHYLNLQSLFHLWNKNSKTIKNFKQVGNISKKLTPSKPAEIQLLKPPTNRISTQSSNSTKFKHLIGCKFLTQFLKNKLSHPLYLLKRAKKLSNTNINNSKSVKFDESVPSTMKNSFTSSTSNSYKSKHVSATVFKIPNPQSILVNNTKKMVKTRQKSVQYALQQRNIEKICLYFYLTFKRILAKIYRELFLILKQKTGYKNLQHQAIQQQEGDSPQIITNILKHLCWLSSVQIQKQKKKKTTHQQQLKKIKLKLLLLKIKRKQFRQVKNVFKKWNRVVISYKFYIVDNIRRLEDLKEKYIQSYK